MDTLDLANLIHLLKSDSTIQHKKNVYLQIQEYLKRQKNTNFSGEELVAIIKSHLKGNELVAEALTTWILYAKLIRYLPEGIIETVYNCKNSLDQMFPLFCELLNGDLLSIEQILSSTNLNINKEIVAQLFKASNKVSFKTYLDFINKEVVSVIFKTNNDETRNILIDFVLLNDLFSVVHYNTNEQKQITNIFKEKYLKVVHDLRIQNDKSWYKLCIFVIKYCGKLLHSEIELTNMILNNVESGFKTKTVPDRLMSYECWKVLIDICSLDYSYICSAKQLRLLIKPLKVKLSKNEEVMRKRFEIWFYLAKVLQETVINCLDEFLKFSFELTNETDISDMCIDSDIVKRTWTERTEVLIAVIGHSDSDCKCLEVKKFKFSTPIVTVANFLEYDIIIINSVYVNCKMISKWDDSTNSIIKIKCLWRSIFKFVQGLAENSKESVLHKVSNVLQRILQDSVTKEKYFAEIFIPIISLLSSFKQPICNSLLLHDIIIVPIINFMLSNQLLDPSWSNEIISLVKSTSNTRNKPFNFNRMCELLKASDCVNGTFFTHFWLYLAEELYDICKMPREGFGDFKEDGIFFLTCIFTWSNFEEKGNRLLPTWRKVFSELCTISNVFAEDLLKNFETIIGINPKSGINILLVLSDISQILLNNKTYKIYAMGLLNIAFMVLKENHTPKDKVILTLPTIKKILSLCTSGDNIGTSIILRIYECIECLLKPHQVFEVLEILMEIIPKLSNNMKKKLPNTLKQVLNDLALSSDVLISKDAIDLLAQIDVDDKKRETRSFVRPSVSSRTAKIASMAKDHLYVSPPKGSMLNLFSSGAKNNVINTSIESNSRIKRIKKLLPPVNNTVNNIDEDSAEYVAINTAVSLNKNKLNTHQREILNKTSADIPALYQDLSQSQHNSMDTSNSCSSIADNKADLSPYDNFQDIICDLKKKNKILQEHCEAALNDTFEEKSTPDCKYTVNSDSRGMSSSNKSVLCINNSNTQFNNISNLIKTAGNADANKYAEDTNRQTHTKAVLCSSKFEEKPIIEPTQTEHIVDNFSLTCIKNSRKKHRNSFIKDKPIRNRRMSDSHIVLQKMRSDSIYNFTDNDLIEYAESTSKHLKTKTKDLKNKLREKNKQYLFSADCSNNGEYQPNPFLSKKCRSFDNLHDIMQKVDVRKVKKCFKIIQSDGDISNSIKLRISITDEKDSSSDIIEQLDTEISKIDANLQNNSSLLNKNNDNKSESLFSSLDILGSSEDPQYSTTELLGGERKIDIRNSAYKHENGMPNTMMTDAKDDSETFVEVHMASVPRVANQKCKESILEKRKHRELDRIKMDIVGAEEFTMVTPRRRRTSKFSFNNNSPTNNGTAANNSGSTLNSRKTSAKLRLILNSSTKHKNSDLSIECPIKSDQRHQAKIKVDKVHVDCSEETNAQKSSVDKEEPGTASSQAIGDTPRKLLSRPAKQPTRKSPKTVENQRNSSKRMASGSKRTMTSLNLDSKSIDKNISNPETCNNANSIRSSRTRLLNVNTDPQIHLQERDTSQILENNGNLVDIREHRIMVENPGVGNDISSLQGNYEQITETLDAIKESSESKENLLELEFPSTTNIQLDDQKSFDFKSETNGTSNSKIETNISVRIEEKSVRSPNNIEKGDEVIVCIEPTSDSNYKMDKNISDNEEDVTFCINNNKDNTRIYLSKKSDIIEQNTTIEDETQSCNPYINIQNESDVIDKLERHGPGVARTLIKDLNFDSLPFAFDTSIKENIQCSPVCDDTPDRNKALVYSTVNISPIKLEYTESQMSEKNNIPLINEEIYLKKPSSRSAKLLNHLPSTSNATHQNNITPKKNAEAEVCTPCTPTQRIRKMILNCGKLHEMPASKQDVDTGANSGSLPIHPFNTVDQNVLEFTRELPSPLATPNYSILKKRKCLETIDDGALPYFKRRKRVNFSDPPITSKKIYYMDCNVEANDAISLASGTNVVKSNSIYPNLRTCTMDIYDVVVFLNQDLHEHFLSMNIKTVGDLAVLNEHQISQLEFLGEPRLKRITEALDIVYSNYTKNTKSLTENDSFPIYPDLIDCSHSIRNILKFLGDIKAGKDLRLRNMRIKTIGDFAKLTKAETSQLSITLPCALNALQKYHRKLCRNRKLATQLKEEMYNDGDSELNKIDALEYSSDLNYVPDIVNTEGKQNEGETSIESTPCETNAANTLLSRKTVEEEIQYITEMYSRNEKYAIFKYLKDTLFAP